MIIIDIHGLSLTIMDCHWCSLMFIDVHWLSLIIIDYHWLSLIVIDHHCFFNTVIHWSSSYDTYIYDTLIWSYMDNQWITSLHWLSYIIHGYFFYDTSSLWNIIIFIHIIHVLFILLSYHHRIISTWLGSINGGLLRNGADGPELWPPAVPPDQVDQGVADIMGIQ